jgi:FYVE/RhoGEF/PH domain-containing protein 3
MPIQRIPRYKLLLTELLKHTPEEHPDFEDLEAAVKLVSSVVGAINEDIKRQEKRFKVIEIQERWDTVRICLRYVVVVELGVQHFNS